MRVSYSLKVLSLVALCLSFLNIILTLYNEEKIQNTKTESRQVTQVTLISTTTRKKPKMYAELLAGLGNHIWMYASMYGIARQSDRYLFACTMYNLTRLFTNISVHMHPYNKCREVMSNETVIISQGQSCYYNPLIILKLRSASDKDALVIGFLQNMVYFFNYTEDIKAQFVIRDIYQAQAQEYLRSVVIKEAVRREVQWSVNSQGQALLGGKTPVFVVVHVRRNDHLKSTYVNVPGPSFFARAMSYMRKKYGEMVIFIVATDDVPWSMENINGSDVYFTGENKMKIREVDFSIGVACNHTVTAISTFGWWMGFLGGGDVIYLRDWVKSFMKKGYVEEQYFPHYWIPM